MKRRDVANGMPNKVAGLFMTGLLIWLPTAEAVGLKQAEEIEPFVAEVVKNHGLDRAKVLAIVKNARVVDNVLEAMSRPAERKSWGEYRKIFMTDKRIRAGTQFYAENRATLKAAEKEYGVPVWTICGIIGVETYFGRIKGRHRVLDSLATLAFRHKRRGKFFRGELGHFLALSETESLDPLTLTGSYAGAMGVPQFIPSSYRSYAVDFDGDGRRNLIDSVDDAIGSVANYLARHGWERGRPVTFRADAETKAYRPLLSKGLKPNTPLARIKAAGIAVPEGINTNQSAALQEFDGATGAEVWLTLQNFYVITRYNRSKLYALAVHQLGEAVAAEVGRR